MNVEVISQEKDDIELRVDNQTVAELLRMYLNDGDNVRFVAWRKEHPSKPLLMRIQSSSGTVKKAVSEAVKAIGKDLEEIENAVKKSK